MEDTDNKFPFHNGNGHNGHNGHNGKRNGKNGKKKFPFHFKGAGGGLFSTLERRVKKLSTVELVLLGVAVVAAADYAIAPKGMSFVAKAVRKVMPGALPALIPPPGVTPATAAAVAKGYFSGANNQAGWNRGASPVGSYDNFNWHGHGGPWHHGYPWA